VPKVKVSVVLPVFNAQNTLERALKSLFEQPEIDQIIVVEDGSSDGSLKLCEEFEKNYDHIELLRHPLGENKGAPASRNLGLTKVKNTWVQFMDADDELVPGKISDQLASIQGNEALVVGKFNFFEDGKTLEIVPLKDPWSALITTRLGINTSNLWNAEWVKKAGGWNESLINIQEYYLMFEILKLKGKVVYSSKNLTRIFSQPHSITNSIAQRDVKRDNYFVFRQEVLDYLISINELTFKRLHYFEICTGSMLRYHQPPFRVKSNKYYFFFYRALKRFLTLLK